MAFLCALLILAGLGPAAQQQNLLPRVFILDAKQLAATKQRLRAGDPVLKPRKALDFLIPFALGDKKWTYQQLGNWPPQMLFPLIRRASTHYDVQSVLKRLPPVEPGLT